MGDVPLTAGLIVTAAGLGVLLSALDVLRCRSILRKNNERMRNLEGKCEIAVSQSREMRAQAEGLALMREIHRSTSIVKREERLLRISTLLAETFEAREVTLLASTGETQFSILPAATLRVSSKEEFFACFSTAQLLSALSQSSERTSMQINRKSAVIDREGCQLIVRGNIEVSEAIVGTAQWKTMQQAQTERVALEDPAEILELALSKIDLSGAACQAAESALQQRRTVKLDSNNGVLQASVPKYADGADGRPLILCVPLMADQKAVGVLRIRRHSEGFDGTDAEALEEMLLESAKHFALALKKDEDDRRAITDGLTSLFIKRHFLTVIEQMRAKFDETNQRFCLILCDIDHFKKVNDTHGHLSGDMVLKAVAATLKTALRANDLAFRYGGEELAVLLPDCSSDSAMQTAERLRANIEAAKIFGEKRQQIPVTISLGISHYEAGMAVEELISRADKGLYRSKQSGRNRATFWTNTLESLTNTPATPPH